MFNAAMRHDHVSLFPPPCFSTSVSLTLKAPQAYNGLTPHRATAPFQSASPPPCATLSQQKRHAPVSSRYHNIDVLNQQPRPRTQSDPTSLSPVIIIPGYGASAREYDAMVEELRNELGAGVEVSVVAVTFSTWISTVGGRPITPVLRLLDDAVQKARKQSRSSKVQLVAHSAGGWIARIYLGELPYPAGSSCVWDGARFVSRLVCLGTPHRSDEGVTRKNMQFVNENYPGAYRSEVEYVNIIGNGAPIAQKRGGAWRFWDSDWFTRLSYCLTDKSIGNDAAEGDGIVPLSSAYLGGAHNICLRGIWHSPSSAGAWYGHPDAVNYWSSFLRARDVGPTRGSANVDAEGGPSR